MEVTKQGKWFMEVFVNKEVEAGDYELARLHDLLEEVQKTGNYGEFAECKEQIEAAKFFGLVK